MTDKDITEFVEFGLPDGDILPIDKCACGTRYLPWDFLIGMNYDPRRLHMCRKCGRKMYFEMTIKIFEASSD